MTIGTQLAIAIGGSMGKRLNWCDVYGCKCPADYDMQKYRRLCGFSNWTRFICAHHAKGLKMSPKWHIAENEGLTFHSDQKAVTWKRVPKL